MAKNPAVSTRSASLGSIKFAPRAKRTSLYDTVVDQVAKLKPGPKGVVAVRPKGVTLPMFQARVGAALRRAIDGGKITLSKGVRMSKRSTESGDVAIFIAGKGGGCAKAKTSKAAISSAKAE